MSRKIRYGMVGGGRGAFIGAVHRIAANMDGQIELVAGAFSSDAAKSKASGEDLFLDPARVYATFDEMVRMDLRYVRTWSLLLDLKILFKTVMIVLRKNGGG